MDLKFLIENKGLFLSRTKTFLIIALQTIEIICFSQDVSGATLKFIQIFLMVPMRIARPTPRFLALQNLAVRPKTAGLLAFWKVLPQRNMQKSITMAVFQMLLLNPSQIILLAVFKKT